MLSYRPPGKHLHRLLDIFRAVEAELLKTDRNLNSYPSVRLSETEKVMLHFRCMPEACKHYVLLHGKSETLDQVLASIKFYDSHLVVSLDTRRRWARPHGRMKCWQHSRREEEKERKEKAGRKEKTRVKEKTARVLTRRARVKARREDLSQLLQQRGSVSTATRRGILRGTVRIRSGMRAQRPNLQRKPRQRVR